MKVSRFKKSHKILTFFSTNFNYREPYLILIDATFCQAALKHKVNIEEQLKKYLQTALHLVTTQCIILEAESLGGPIIGATKIVKQFQVHKCGHEGKPVTAVECIKAMTKTARYIVASQDRTLQEILRKVPGRCLLYLHHATPVLEAPSTASKKWVNKKSKELLDPTIKAQANKLTVKPKKRLRNPNPLSCKKSKKQKEANTNPKTKTSQATNTVKTKRKRIKIPKHIKEIIQKDSN